MMKIIIMVNLRFTFKSLPSSRAYVPMNHVFERTNQRLMCSSLKETLGYAFLDIRIYPSNIQQIGLIAGN